MRFQVLFYFPTTSLVMREEQKRFSALVKFLGRLVVILQRARKASWCFFFSNSDVDWLHSGAFVGMYISANNATFDVFECYDGQIGGQYGAIIVISQTMYS
jgi:hypothetical protein